jgi:broad specificity phosphatase PhoE
MQFFLIRHGQADSARSTDPYAPPLTELGHAQAAAASQACRGWDLQFLCASTMRRAQETADIIHDQLPGARRWDLEELEDIALQDLNYEPTATHLVSTWTEEQFDRGLERVWIRVMAALARIQIYAETNSLERIGIVAHGSTLTLLLLNWLGQDWTAHRQLLLPVDNGATCRVDVEEDRVTIVWLNRI